MALDTIEHLSDTLNFVVAPRCLEHLHAPDLSNALLMKNTDFKIIVFMDVTCCPEATLWRDFLPPHSTLKIATA
jgi:hypothetical protein